MPYRVVQFLETPNPNAVKCVLDRSPAPEGPRSFRSREEAAADALAAALFAVPGVRNVLIHDGWITVGKAEDAPWRTVRDGLRAALAAAP